jgi:hypothetical protein
MIPPQFPAGAGIAVARPRARPAAAWSIEATNPTDRDQPRSAANVGGAHGRIWSRPYDRRYVVTAPPPETNPDHRREYRCVVPQSASMATYVGDRATFRPLHDARAGSWS